MMADTAVTLSAEGRCEMRLHVQCHLRVAAVGAVVAERILRTAHAELHDRRLRDAHLRYQAEAWALTVLLWLWQWSKAIARILLVIAHSLA